jgi:hypothetical protein
MRRSARFRHALSAQAAESPWSPSSHDRLFASSLTTSLFQLPTSTYCYCFIVIHYFSFLLPQAAESPLFPAAMKGHEGAVAALLAAGVDVHAKDPVRVYDTRGGLTRVYASGTRAFGTHARS